MNFVVLCSSRGTTFQATLDAMNRGELLPRCIGLITDAPTKECIAKAEAAGIPYRVAERIKDEERELLDKKVDMAIHELATEANVDADTIVIAEMGWMWIHTPWFISQWKNRILNVHPALLPNYGGKGMYGLHVHKAVIDAAEDETGITIHVMDEGVDTGPILVQKSCSVNPDDTPESLQARVQELEKEWYPKTLQMIEDGELQMP